MGQVKSRKLEYFGHVSRHNSLEKNIMKDIMLGFMPGTKRQGGQKRQWIDNVTQWTRKGLAENREIYRRFESRPRVFTAPCCYSNGAVMPSLDVRLSVRL